MGIFTPLFRAYALVFFIVVKNFFLLLGIANFAFPNTKITTLIYLWPGLYPSVVVPLMHLAEV